MSRTFFARSALALAIAGVFVMGSTAQAGPPITASLDTGVDSDQLLGVRAPGFDFVDNDADTNDRSPNSHGTFQALIFHDNAPTLRYMPLRTYFGNGDPMILSRGQAAIDFALANPDVKVLMVNRLQPIDVGRLKTAANRDVVVLVNSGNSGAPNPQSTATLIPQLEGQGLIVGGHDANGVIAPESNRPGAAFAEHTITARHDSARTDTKGTSFALPRVAAAAARVKTRDPHLTPYQVVEILKRTAIDAGAPGVDGVYGHGLLNANAAFNAVGTINVPDGGDSGGGGGSSSSSSGAAAAGALLVGGGLYALFKRNQKLKSTLILDEYGRSFWMDLTAATPRRDRTPSLNLKMADLRREQRVMQLTDTDAVQSYAVIRADSDDFRAMYDVDNTDYRGTDNVSYSFFSVHESGREMAFSVNESQNGRFGAMSLLPEETRAVDFITGDVLGAPYMGFTDEGLSSAFKFDAGNNIDVKFGLSANDDERRWGLESDSAFFETSYETPRFGLALQLGELREDGSLFGGASDGPFSVDSARTLSLGLSGRYNLNEKTALIGSYMVGMTDVRDQDPSIVQNFSTLKSDSYGAGLVSANVFRRGDTFGLGVFQPLRVTSGEVDAVVPQSRDEAGNIFSDSGRYSLVPDGAETNYELYYSIDLGRDVRLGSHFLYRDEPLHDADADRERVVMFTLDRGF